MFYAITAGFIAFDYLTGTIKAIKAKELSSSIMRQGLFNKAGFLLCIILGALCDFGQGYMDIGFTIPVSKAICTYIVFTEIGSSIENLSAINPSLIPTKLQEFFVKIKK